MSGQSTTTASVDTSFSLIGRPLLARAVLLIVAFLAFVCATRIADAAETARSVATDPELAMLLRAMAGLKALIAASAIGVMVWRLGSPVGPVRMAFYVLASSAMTAGPVLIWTLANVGCGVALLHGGLLATLLLLWRDPVVGARLQAAINDRRLALR